MFSDLLDHKPFPGRCQGTAVRPTKEAFRKCVGEIRSPLKETLTLLLLNCVSLAFLSGRKDEMLSPGDDVD